MAVNTPVSSPHVADNSRASGASYKGELDDGSNAGRRVYHNFAPFAEGTRDFTANEVSAANNTITLTAHQLPNSAIIRFTTTGTLPAGLAAATDYYIVSRTADTFKVSLSDGGAAVDITDTGSGIHTYQIQTNLRMLVATGTVWVNGAPSEIAPQRTAALVAPTVNIRRDIVYVSRAGTVGVKTGTEAASPSDPAIPFGNIPIARISWTVGMTQITNNDLDDLRVPAFEPVATPAARLYAYNSFI